MTAPIATWLAEPLPDGVATALRRLAASDDVRYVAVMPDVHLADEVCIGTVAATRRLLYPSAVGADIGCGVVALRFDAEAQVIAEPRAAARILAGLSARVPVLQHAVARAPDLPPALEATPLSDGRLERLKAREGRLQLGTLGRGNHFLELQAEESEGTLWLMLHSGSRALGQAIRDHHLRTAQASATGLGFVDGETAPGEAYRGDLEWALAWADASRRAMVAEVAALLEDQLGIRADWSSLASCHHNHVRREHHFGEELWVHRKGAIPAAAGEPGIIPGSMGAPSYHVEGRGHEPALASSAHGAGRAMSRTEARRRISSRDLLRQLEGVRFDHRRVDQLRDEAPAAYKNIRAVLRAQRELTRVVRVLRPVLVYKG